MSSLRDKRSSRIEDPLASATPAARLAGRGREVVIGTITSVAANGDVKVNFAGTPAGLPVAALTTVVIGADDIGRRVALSFIEGDPARPLVLGLIREETTVVTAGGSDTQRAERGAALLDGERVVLTAQSEIELKCGKASITLTRAGKILIRGAYVLSRSSGANRLQGGSVEIN